MTHISNNYEARVKMSRERSRLSQVRKSFDAGMEQKKMGAIVQNEFFHACVYYIETSMDRLHAQDQRIHDFLIPHVEEGNEHSETLENLDMRLARSREALNQLVSASRAYKDSGNGGWNDFTAAVDTFMDVYFNILLSAQHSTLAMQEEIFDEQTWNQVAGVSLESLTTENMLYDTVKSFAPVNANPASFKSGPPGLGARPNP